MQAAHSHNAEVVGKRLCRVLAPHVLCPDSVGDERLEKVAAVPSEVAGPIAVKGHLHHRVLGTEGRTRMYEVHSRGSEASGSTDTGCGCRRCVHTEQRKQLTKSHPYKD